jgi:hypothetical protein
MLRRIISGQGICDLAQFMNGSAIPGVRQAISSGCRWRFIVDFVVGVKVLVEVPAHVIFVFGDNAGKRGSNQAGDLGCREERMRFVRGPYSK